MKKWIVPAALVLMLALAACAPACVSERAPAGGESSGAGETTGTQVLSDGEKALEELAEPPALTVSCGWDQITLSWSGNASWSKAGPGGEGETWICLRPPPPGQSRNTRSSIPASRRGRDRQRGEEWPPSPRR